MKKTSFTAGFLFKLLKRIINANTFYCASADGDGSGLPSVNASSKERKVSNTEKSAISLSLKSTYTSVLLPDMSSILVMEHPRNESLSRKGILLK